MCIEVNIIYAPVFTYADATKTKIALLGSSVYFLNSSKLLCVVVISNSCDINSLYERKIEKKIKFEN